MWWIRDQKRLELCSNDRSTNVILMQSYRLTGPFPHALDRVCEVSEKSEDRSASGNKKGRN